MPARERAAGVEIHLGRFFLMSAVLLALSGSTVSLCPRICLRFQVQPRMLDALKAALALEDQFVQHPHTRIQVCVPDSVGVKQVVRSSTCPPPPRLASDSRVGVGGQRDRVASGGEQGQDPPA